ncbi:MAG: DUF711 family protein [Chloroflexota bacterium]
MNIRSITIFFPVNARQSSALPPAPDLTQAENLRRSAWEAYRHAGFTVQSCRLATQPFPQYLSVDELGQSLDWVQAFERQALQAGFDYTSLGPALPDSAESISAVVEILRATQTVFTSAMLTQQGRVELLAVQRCAQAICTISQIETNGFANLRFAALANVPAGAPFFPAAYHQGQKLAFALAMEAADMFIEEISPANDLHTAQRRLVSRIESEAQRLTQVGEELAGRFQAQFLGIDFTPAPFPEPWRSFGNLLEKLGVPKAGLHGTLAASAFITSTLDQAHFRRTGFNGLMLPVLEDSTLAQRAAEGSLSVKDLLLYSAVCGTGLDTLPLAGDVSAAALSALLLDLSALALRLNKPLTARLMPIPGRKAGEMTTFDFDYFANSRILPLEAAPLENFLQEGTSLPIQSKGG